MAFQFLAPYRGLAEPSRQKMMEGLARLCRPIRALLRHCFVGLAFAQKCRFRSSSIMHVHEPPALPFYQACSAGSTRLQVVGASGGVAGHRQ